MVNQNTPQIPVEAENQQKHRRQGGFSLIELTVSVSIFAIALMSTGLTLLHGVRAQEESITYSDSLRSVRDVYAEIQQISNQPQDVTKFQGISAVYTLYNGLTRAVPELPGGTMTCVVFANEAAIPVELGGPQDLNFDGDANDDLGGSADGTDLQLIPFQLTVSYTDDRGTITQIFYRRIGQTTD
jgi:prepilin-type N-terminal cleavage/methylation domain-containing protein